MKIKRFPVFIGLGLYAVAILIGTSYGQITDPKILSDPLVKESRDLILKLGFSETYFDRHFRLLRFTGDLDKLTKPDSAQQILWQFNIGEFHATVDDNVGFRIDDHGIRHPVHSLAFDKDLKLPTVHDIRTVLSKKRAEELMRACIGSIDNERVYLNLFDFHQTGILLLLAPYSAPCGPEGSTPPCPLRNGVVNLETGEISGCNRATPDTTDQTKQ